MPYGRLPLNCIHVFRSERAIQLKGSFRRTLRAPPYVNSLLTGCLPSRCALSHRV